MTVRDRRRTVSRVRHLNPPTVAAARGYSHAVEAVGGRTLYVAGQVALAPDGTLVGPGDVRVQAEQVFENLRAVLAAGGADYGDVVKLGFYLRDFTAFDAVRAVRDQYVDTANPPASTAVAVVSLAAPEFLIEVDAVAVLE